MKRLSDPVTCLQGEEAMNKIVIAIDIGGTNFRIACADRYGNLSNLHVYPSHSLLETSDPIRHTAHVIYRYIDAYAERKNILAVSIGLPGEISTDGQTPLSMPNLRSDQFSFDGKNLVYPLGEILKLPVLLNKDANNHLLCDIKLQNLDRESVILGVYFGTGVGCSAYINKKFFLGTHGAAMVLGHIPFYKSQMVSHVGSYGCAETHASGYRLSKIREEKFPQIPFPELFTHCGNDPDILDFIEAQATTVATVATLLDPAALVLGGGVLEMQDYPTELLHQRIRALCKQPYPASDLTILSPLLPKYTGIIGAAFYAFDQLS